MGITSRGCQVLVLSATAERRNLLFRSDLGLPWIRTPTLRLTSQKQQYDESVRRSWRVFIEIPYGTTVTDGNAAYQTNCCPPSMSYVAPVSAVLIMMCTASAATSAGPTTRRIGSVARSVLRRCSS
jgi:hypothetical protein